MTDDISKVYAALRSIRYNANNGSQGRPLHHRLSLIANEAEKAIAAIESATTPAEVGEVGEALDALQTLESDIDGESGCTDTVRAHIATLARQLAKSERDCAELRALLTAQNAAIARTDDLARQLAEANSELAMHRVDATRVAACPWRVQKGHTSECQPPKRLQDALDQLAEATRRLGEVEGLVSGALTIQQMHYGDGMGTHLALIGWARDAKAALTKEPAHGS